MLREAASAFAAGWRAWCLDEPHPSASDAEASVALVSGWEAAAHDNEQGGGARPTLNEADEWASDFMHCGELDEWRHELDLAAAAMCSAYGYPDAIWREVPQHFCAHCADGAIRQAVREVARWRPALVAAEEARQAHQRNRAAWASFALDSACGRTVEAPFDLTTKAIDAARRVERLRALAMVESSRCVDCGERPPMASRRSTRHSSHCGRCEECCTCIGDAEELRATTEAELDAAELEERTVETMAGALAHVLSCGVAHAKGSCPQCDDGRSMLDRYIDAGVRS